MYIKSAPKNRRILLGYTTPLEIRRATGLKPPGGLKQPIYVVIGWWDEQLGRERPVPFWTNELVESIGIITLRNNPPAVWMDLPVVSLETGNGKSGESKGISGGKVLSKAEGGAGVA
jgi:hypothetical protein